MLLLTFSARRRQCAARIDLVAHYVLFRGIWVIPETWINMEQLLPIRQALPTIE